MTAPALTRGQQRQAQRWLPRCQIDPSTGCLLPDRTWVNRHSHVFVDRAPMPLYRLFYINELGYQLGPEIGLRRTCQTSNCVSPQHRQPQLLGGGRGD